MKPPCLYTLYAYVKNFLILAIILLAKFILQNFTRHLKNGTLNNGMQFVFDEAYKACCSGLDRVYILHEVNIIKHNNDQNKKYNDKTKKRSNDRNKGTVFIAFAILCELA